MNFEYWEYHKRATDEELIEDILREKYMQYYEISKLRSIS